jgi:hypothetical protein
MVSMFVPPGPKAVEKEEMEAAMDEKSDKVET